MHFGAWSTVCAVRCAYVCSVAYTVFFSGGGGLRHFFPFLKKIGSIIQTWSRGTHRTSTTSLTSGKTNLLIQMGRGFYPPPPKKKKKKKPTHLPQKNVFRRECVCACVYSTLHKTYLSEEVYWYHVHHYTLYLKEELHNRFNSISEERVKFFKHNSENLMKIGWKIRMLWHFEVSQIFKKHFLTSRYEYANEWGDDVITSQFSIHFVHRNDKNFIF